MTAASAAPGSSPRWIALATLPRKLFTSLRPFDVSANVTPARLSAAGFPGAWFQSRSSSVLTSSALSGSETSGGSGKLTGTISGRPAAAMSLARLYSSPAPSTCARTPASRATAPARSTSSISLATNIAGCLPPITGWSASHDTFSSGRSFPAGDLA